jgi:hypothetical protein
MKKQIITALLASLTVLALTAATVEHTSPSHKNAAKLRIGIYDSRAVATAYCGTHMHEVQIKILDDALKEAKATGIPEKIRECDTAVWDARKRLHRQGFGTYPVDDILAKIPSEVAAIKTQVNISDLVSKWDNKNLAKYKHAERIDVTAQLIDAFHPSDRRRKVAEDIQKHKPLSPKAVENAIQKEKSAH